MPEDYGRVVRVLDGMERDAVQQSRAEAAQARSEVSAKPAAIRLLDADPFEAQRQREGEALLGAMRTAGIGSEWVSDGGLMGGER
jgi:hypothetical protein